MMSREMGELVRVVKQAYRHRDSSDTFVYSRPRVVHNASLLNKVIFPDYEMTRFEYIETSFWIRV